MKAQYKIIETYWKTIEVNAKTRSEEKLNELALAQAQQMSLGKLYGQSDKQIGFARDVLPEEAPTWWDRLISIYEATDVNWYQTMQPWQREELTKEELFKYAEEMREALDKIFDIAYEFERNGYN